MILSLKYVTILLFSALIIIFTDAIRDNMESSRDKTNKENWRKPTKVYMISFMKFS